MKRELKLIALLFPLAVVAQDAGPETETAVEPASGPEVVAEADPAAPLELTLTSAMERIKAENPAVLFSRENVRRALERSYQSRAGLLPQVGLRVSQQRQKGRFLPSSNSQTFNFYEATLDASVPLIDAEQYASYKISQLGLMVEERNFEAAVQEILELTIATYFTVLRDLRQVELRESDLERDRILLQRSVDQEEAGLANRLDVLRSEQRVFGTQRQLRAARAQLAGSQLELKALLDLGYQREIVLIDQETIFRGENGINVEPDMRRYRAMRASVANRPELRAQRGAIEQAEMERKRAGRQSLPVLEAFGSYGQDSRVIFDGDEQELWLAGVAVSMPIFEGFRISAEKREADAQVRQTEYQLRDLENTFSSEFQLALEEVRLGFEEIQFAAQERDSATSEVELELERFEAGLTDDSDLTLARQRQSDAEDALLDAIYRYGLSRLRLARAIGAVERVLE